MVAGAEASEESPSCTERGCLVKAREACGQLHVDSPDWRAACRVRATETRPAGNCRSEKGNPPRSNLRIGRLQVARRGRKTRAVTKATTWPVPNRTERDDHREQNSAYSPTLLTMVPIAQSAERLSVEQEVAGSCPARHPKKVASMRHFFCFWLNRTSLLDHPCYGRIHARYALAYFRQIVRSQHHSRSQLTATS